MERTWELLIGWCEMVIRVLRMRRNPHQLTLPLPPNLPVYHSYSCLALTFVMVCLLSSFLVVLPGRPFTACIKEYYGVEKYIENAVKSTKFISIFDTLRKFKLI